MMKVLLYGEFSSLHNYLKQGFQNREDVEVTLVSNGDGYKKIGGADLTLPEENKKNIWSRIRYYSHYLDVVRTFKGFDVVQIVNPSVIPYIIGKKVIDILAKNNSKLFLVAGGVDYALVKAYNDGRFEYNIFDDMPDVLGSYKSRNIMVAIKKKYESYLVDSVNKVIPILYEYAVGYEQNKTSGVIPAPVNLSSLEYRENEVQGKIVFFHGLNDERKKGTKYIRKALEALQCNYPDEVEVIINGKMPFADYIKILGKTNVVIDQCMCYGYGINACISMAQGKVVMAGARPETLKAFGVEESPIIHIKPDVDYIYEKLEYVVKNRKKIPEWGRMSRKYVEEVHDMNRIADMYMNIWKNS